MYVGCSRFSFALQMFSGLEQTINTSDGEVWADLMNCGRFARKSVRSNPVRGRWIKKEQELGMFCAILLHYTHNVVFFVRLL